MNPGSYNLIFHGDIASGHTIDEVKQKLSVQFNIEHNRIDRLFTHTPFLVKAHIDYKTATKYQILFEWAGALCTIESVESIPKTMPQNSRENCQRCDVIFTGKIRKGYQVEDVQCNLMTFLHLNKRRINELFVGVPVILMQDVSYPPALKIQTGFELAGAICTLKMISQPLPSEIHLGSLLEEQAQLSSRPYMTCPKCGFRQWASRKCCQCGIYTGNYLKRKDECKGKQSKPPSKSSHIEVPKRIPLLAKLINKLQVFSKNKRNDCFLKSP